MRHFLHGIRKWSLMVIRHAKHNTERASLGLIGLEVICGGTCMLETLVC